MIEGTVDGREARIKLTIRGPKQTEQNIDVVVDTGYTASLSLPPHLITALELTWQGFGRGTLADGSECLFDVFEGEAIWDGKIKRLLSDEADTDPLLGMALLEGYMLQMEVRPQGKVEISALSN